MTLTPWDVLVLRRGRNPIPPSRWWDGRTHWWTASLFAVGNWQIARLIR